MANLWLIFYTFEPHGEALIGVVDSEEVARRECRNKNYAYLPATLNEINHEPWGRFTTDAVWPHA